MWYRRDVLEDEKAYEIILELYTTKYQEAMREIERYLGNQISWDEKHDLVQEGFLRLLEHVELLNNRDFTGRVKYMRRTMKNLAIDEGRRRSKRRVLGLPALVDSEEWNDFLSNRLTPEDEIVGDEERQECSRHLCAALEKLCERDRELLIEKYANGLSERVIGLKLGIPERNVGTYLSRARRRMKSHFDDEKENRR